MTGFDMVVYGSPIKYLFDDKDLELLIRGSEVSIYCTHYMNLVYQKLLWRERLVYHHCWDDTGYTERKDVNR